MRQYTYTKTYTVTIPDRPNVFVPIQDKWHKSCYASHLFRDGYDRWTEESYSIYGRASLYSDGYVTYALVHRGPNGRGIVML